MLVEFRSVVDAVRCAIEVQNGMLERNAGVPEDRRVEFRIGVHLGDVVERATATLWATASSRRGSKASRAGPSLFVRGRLSTSARWDQEDFIELGKAAQEHRSSRQIYEVKVDSNAWLPSQRSEVAAGAPRLSIVVLPFANLGGDSAGLFCGRRHEPDDRPSNMSDVGDWAKHRFATRASRSISSDRTRVERPPTFWRKRSAQRNRMRVNAAIDAERQSSLGGTSTNRCGPFDMQDEIVARLANALDTQLIIAEARRAERAPSPDSLDLFFQGMSAYNKGLTPDRISEANRLFERALTLDPNNVDAIVGAARTESAFAWSHISDDRASRLGAAEALVVKALSIAPEKASAHLSLGVVQIYTNRVAQGISEFERALAIDRNLAAAHAYIGLAKCFAGRGEETETHVQDALRLSYRDTSLYLWHAFAGNTKVFLGKDEEAVTRLRHAIEMNRNFQPAHFYLAVALARLNRLDEARIAAKDGLSIDPTFTIRRYRADAPSHNPVFLAQRQRIYEMMTKVGLPEG
jgi:tetratricopeptide (TPR) repeat protein